jgi:hypothetical protein
MIRSANLKGYLQQLARSYNEVYHRQEHPDFWGLREFYSTVKAINRYLKGQSALEPSILLKALLRNYGGRPHELDLVINEFFESLGLPIPTAEYKSITIESLIRENLREPEARHLMLLTRSNAALGLLLDQDILSHSKTEIIFGSDFPMDQTDLQICLNIQQIKLCMAEGISVVLVHSENLYESLYDLLNQHYCEYGGQKYVRLAFGTNSRLCPIHPEFRVIVIVEKLEAYTKLAPPLLNRFEKQVFAREDVLTSTHLDMFKELHQFLLAITGGNKDKNSQNEEKIVRENSHGSQDENSKNLNIFE